MSARSTRQLLGLDVMPDQRVAEVASTLIKCLPTDRLKALVESGAKSADAAERHEAKEAAILLFAQEQIRSLMVNSPAEEAVAIAKAMLKRQREVTPL